MKKSALLPLVIVSTFAFIQTSKADVLAGWTFETSMPTSSGPYSPESGSQTGTATILGSHASGTTTFSTFQGNGSLTAFEANHWAVGDYWQFTVSTIGFENISLSYSQNGSSTGPAVFQLAYSLDGTTFNNVGSTYTIPSGVSWHTATTDASTSFSDDLSGLIALNGISKLYFRIIDEATTSVGGGNVGLAGADYIDNVIVSGTPVAAVPEPSAITLATIGGIVCFFMMRRRH